MTNITIEPFVEACILGALAWLIRGAVVIPLSNTIDRLNTVLDLICTDHELIHDTRDLTGQLYEHQFQQEYERKSEEWGHPPVSRAIAVQLVDQEIGTGIA